MFLNVRGAVQRSSVLALVSAPLTAFAALRHRQNATTFERQATRTQEFEYRAKQNLAQFIEQHKEDLYGESAARNRAEALMSLVYPEHLVKDALARLRDPKSLPPWRWIRLPRAMMKVWTGDCSTTGVALAVCDEQAAGRIILTVQEASNVELKPLSEPPAQGQTAYFTEDGRVATIQGQTGCGHDVQRDVSIERYRCGRSDKSEASE